MSRLRAHSDSQRVARRIAIARETVELDDTLAAARRFAEGLRVVRRRYPRVRMFMRAEDAFGFVLRVGDDMRELEAEEAALARPWPWVWTSAWARGR